MALFGRGPGTYMFSYDQNESTAHPSLHLQYRVVLKARTTNSGYSANRRLITGTLIDLVASQPRITTKNRMLFIVDLRTSFAQYYLLL